MSIAATRAVLAAIRAMCKIVPISEDTHDVGLQIVERPELSIHDATNVASAPLAGCKTPVSQDKQDGQTKTGRLVVQNPFR